MDLPIVINKLIVSNRFLKGTVFWYWFRYVNHSNWRFDDHQRYSDFWLNLNRGYHDTEYKYQFEEVWGNGAKPPKVKPPWSDEE